MRSWTHRGHIGRADRSEARDTAPMTETFEYGYVHLVDVTAIRTTDRREWVGLTQTGTGTTVYGTGASAITILNQLGQEGWMINDTLRREVEKNVIPPWMAQMLADAFGRLGRIHTRAEHFMSRRITWNDGPGTTVEP